MDDVALELNDPGFSLCDFFVQLTDLPLQLLYDFHIVTFLQIKLAYPNFVLTDTILVFTDLIFLLIDLIGQLIVLFDRFVVLPTHWSPQIRIHSLC